MDKLSTKSFISNSSNTIRQSSEQLSEGVRSEDVRLNQDLQMSSNHLTSLNQQLVSTKNELNNINSQIAITQKKYDKACVLVKQQSADLVHKINAIIRYCVSLDKVIEDNQMINTSIDEKNKVTVELKQQKEFSKRNYYKLKLMTFPMTCKNTTYNMTEKMNYNSSYS